MSSAFASGSVLKRVAHVSTATLLALVALSPRAAGGEADPHSGQCGGRAVGLVLTALKIPHGPVEELSRLAGAGADGITTFEGVAQALAGHSVHTDVVRLGERAPQCLSIALLLPEYRKHAVGHFVVLLPVERARRQVVEVSPPGSVSLRHWGGRRAHYYALALVCSIRSPSTESGAGLGAWVVVLIGLAAILCLPLAVRLVARGSHTAVCFVLGLAIGLSGCGQGRGGAPELHFLPETNMELGVVAPYSEHEVLLKNTGGAPAVIARVTSSCGCVKAQLDRAGEPIQPGENRKLTFGIRVAPGGSQTTGLVVWLDGADPVRLCVRAVGVAPRWVPEARLVDAGRLYIGEGRIIECALRGHLSEEEPLGTSHLNPRWRSSHPAHLALHESLVERDGQEVRAVARFKVAPNDVGETRAWTACNIQGENEAIEIRWTAVSPLGLAEHVVVTEPTERGRNTVLRLDPLDSIQVLGVEVEGNSMEATITEAGPSSAVTFSRRADCERDFITMAWVTVRALEDGRSWRVPLRVVSGLQPESAR